MSKKPKRNRVWGDPFVRTRPGVASGYIQRFAAIRRGTKVVIACRVSFWEQHRTGKLRRQVQRLRSKAEAAGGIVVGVVSKTWSGKEPEVWLPRAVKLAKRHGAVIVARATDRLIRHRDHHTIENPDALPLDSDFKRLAIVADGVPLVTLFDPDASLGEIRSEYAKGNAGRSRATGRRTTYRRGLNKVAVATRSKAFWLLGARQSAIASGIEAPTVSLDAISKATGRSRSTLQSWAKRFEKTGRIRAVRICWRLVTRNGKSIVKIRHFDERGE